MILDDLLVNLPAGDFLRDYYFRQPYSCAKGARSFSHLGDWPVLERILVGRDVDVMVVKEAEQRRIEQPSYLMARELYSQGHTIVVRNAQLHHPLLKELAERFFEAFRGAIDIHLYFTPVQQFGFGWHYDAEDVFILQTSGTKLFRLRFNTLHPFPVEESLPGNMSYEREISPLIECELSAGDWLYIPAGYWHAATAGNDGSISIAVGVMSLTALDVFDFLRRQLVQCPIWRQRLPVPNVAPGDQRQMIASYEALFDRLGKDLALQLGQSRFTRQFLEHLLGRELEPATRPREEHPADELLHALRRSHPVR